MNDFAKEDLCYAKDIVPPLQRSLFHEKKKKKKKPFFHIKRKKKKGPCKCKEESLFLGFSNRSLGKIIVCTKHASNHIIMTMYQVGCIQKHVTVFTKTKKKHVTVFLKAKQIFISLKTELFKSPPQNTTQQPANPYKKVTKLKSIFSKPQKPLLCRTCVWFLGPFSMMIMRMFIANPTFFFWIYVFNQQIKTLPHYTFYFD